MKISKLLVLGTLLLALCMAVPAMASQVDLKKNTDRDIVYEPGVNPENMYYVGDTIHYVLRLTNPVGNPATNTINEFWDVLPDGSTHYFISQNPANSPDTGVALVQTPGQLNTYYIDYTVTGLETFIVLPNGNNIVNNCYVSGIDSLFDTVTASAQRNSLVLQPNTAVGITADPAGPVCVGDEVDLIVTEENTGDDPLDAVEVTVWNDDGPVLVATLIAPPDSGDTGADGILGVGETWTWTISGVVVTGTTTWVAFGYGEDSLGNSVAFPTYPTEKDEVEVTTIDPPVCLIQGPDEVCEGSDPVQYCASVDDADSYLWEITGDGAIVGNNDEVCVMVSPTGPGGFTLSIEICYATCCSTCDLPVDVIPTPDCTITGPESICDSDIGIAATYCSDATAAHYQWVIISGPATIDGADDAQCVDIIPSALGTIVLELQLWDDFGDQEVCGNSCQIEILVEECGKTFCSFTQGFWGNAGGTKCGGQTTSELIAAALLANGGTITVGLPGHQITFNSVQCILDSLPAGGKPAVLPAGNWTCATLVNSGLAKKNKPELNNVLVGQAVALTLNLLVSEGCVEDSGILADWVLPAEFCTVPYGDEEACAEYSSIPASLVGKTVAEMLAAVNAALAGTGSLSDAYGAATAINEGFDECRTIVPCIRPEICGNGCDDDGDGLIDGLDVIDCPQASI